MKSKKKGYFRQKNLKILWKQILWGNSELLNLQAENLISGESKKQKNQIL